MRVLFHRTVSVNSRRFVSESVNMTVKKTIAEQVAELSSPAPFADPEDDFNYETQARVVPGATSDDDELTIDGSSSFQSGSIRRQATSLLEERDSRYTGRRTSRKELNQDSEDDSDDDEYDSDRMEDEAESLEEEPDEEDDDEDEEIAAFREMMKKEKKASQKSNHPTSDEVHKDADSDKEEEEDAGDEDSDEDGNEMEKDIYSGKVWEQIGKKKIEEDNSGSNEDESDFDESDENEDDEEEEMGEENDDKEDSDVASEEEETSDVEVVSKVNLDEEIQKGLAAKNQQGLWDNFLEARIKLQKALQLSNQLPQFTTHHNFIQLGDEELREGATAGRRKLKKLLKTLVDLQDELLMQNSETQHIVTGEKQKDKGEGSDEEITSEDEDQETPGEEIKKRESLKRKVDLSNPGEELAKRHKRFEKYRNTVLYSWYDRTKLASGKLSSKSFRSLEKSPLEQVEQIMMEKNRLIHRTQMKRSVYRVLGQGEGDKQREKDVNGDGDTEEVPDATGSTQLRDVDPEIFDDDDFYHQLLKELIERKTADTTDPAQLTRQWLAVQKLRSKIKRVVDTKASKGRKLRYDVHSKMVSFMAPRDESNMTDEARNELFHSLFGQTSLTEETVR